MMLWTWVYKYLFEYLLATLLSLYLEEDLLDHMVNCILIFLRNRYCFLQRLSCFTFLSVIYKGFNFSTSLPTLIFCFILIVAILKGVRDLIVVLICISLRTSDIKQFFHTRSVQEISGHLIWKIDTFIEEDTRYRIHCTQDNDNALVPFRVGTLGPHTVLQITISCSVIFCWISSMVWNLFPLKGDCSFGKSQKSQGTKSGL